FHAGDVIGEQHVELGGGEDVPQLAGKAAIERGDDHRASALEHLGRVRRAAQDRDRAGLAALSGEGRGQRAQRREDAPGDDQHAGSAGCADPRGGPHRGTTPLETTSTPARLVIRPPWAAITAGRALAGTARQTMSDPSRLSSEARSTRTASGNTTPGR